jgi:hypothetical protein
MAQTLPLNVVLQKVWNEEPLNDPRGELPLSLAPTGGVSVSTTDEEVSEIREPTRDGEGESEGDDEQQGNAEDDNKSFLSAYLAKHDGWLQRTNKALEDQVDDAGDKIEDITLSLFVDFAEKTANVLRRSLSDRKTATQAMAMVPNGEGYLKPEKRGPVSHSIKVDKPSDAIIKRRLEREFDELEEQYVDEYSDILAPTIEVGFDTQMEFVFNQEQREEIEALRARDKDGRKAILTARGLESFANISKTTSDRIITRIKEGIEAQENLTDIIARVMTEFKEPSLKRAKTIARTETLTAASIGQNAAFESADEVSPGYQKVWINAGDFRVRGKPEGGVGGKFPMA